MRTFFSVILIATAVLAHAGAPERLAEIPAGSIAPFWLDAVSAKAKGARKSEAKIAVKAFASMPRQVTVGEFRKFLASHPEWSRAKVSPLFADESYLSNLKESEVGADQPMTNVSWFAARAYCSSLELRLPTTDEWEYMAAASEKSKDASKDPAFLARILDWYGEPQANHPKKAGSLYRNIYGVWDLHGNVWEWVSDFNSNFISGESREDSALNKDMFCGAGAQAGGNKENYAAFMRYAFRSSLKGNSTTNQLGFRCVRSL